MENRQHPGSASAQPRPRFAALRHVTLCLFAAISLLVSDAASAAALRPNVVLIVADDLGIGEPGCYGGELPTPHIDALANAGVKFSAGYVTAPFCAASRAAIVTGRYQTRFGFEFNPIGAANADPEIGLPATEATLAHVLKNAGYATGLVGKWHLGGTAAFHPQRRGFDEFFGFLHEGHYYVPPPFEDHVTWLRRRALPDGSQGRWSSPDRRTLWSTHMGSNEPDYDADNPLLRSSQPVNELRNLTEAFTQEAEQFIRRHRSQPFFLCLSYNAVHSPLQASDARVEKFAHIEDLQRRIFAALLSHLDDGVGQVMKTLKDCRLEDNTLVVFLSDNGGPTRELTSSNRPFQGGKGQLLEGGIRVPLLLKWPAVLPAGHVEHRMASSLDIFATTIAAAGVAPPRQLDGVDLVPCLTTNRDQPIHDALYWRVGELAACRSGDWKILCRSKKSEAPNWELFNLSTDPGETKSLAAENPDKVDQLSNRFQALNQHMIPPLWQSSGLRWSSPEHRRATQKLFGNPPRNAP